VFDRQTDPSSQWLCPSQTSAVPTHCPLRHVNSPVAAVQLLYAETHIFPPFASTKPTSPGQLHSTPSPLGVHTCEQPPLLFAHGLPPAIRTHAMQISFHLRKQEAQLMLTNPRDEFRGQSWSPNMVPFDLLGMVSYLCAIVTLSIFDL